MTELIFEPKPLSTMQPLNTLTFPLNGCSLIEASAGTGKTYTIVNLYLRLLLGHECQPLSVEQILVVTFTNAATAELRERIRQRLRSAYLDFFAQSSEDHFVQSLIEQSKNLEQDCQKLALASKQMDEAAVYTIHGFCQKALTEHAFESGALYDQSFILDESEWVQIAVEDYWRKHLVPLPSSTLQLVLKMWKSPDDLLKSIYSFIYRDVFVANSQTMEQCLQSISVYQECLEQSKNWWLSNKVSEQLAKANLNGRAKLSKLTFLKNIDEFCQSELMVLNKDIGAWSDLTPEKVQKAAKKGSADLSHLDFSRFETLDEALNKALNAIKVAFSQQAIQVIRANLNSHKQRLHML
ncbi:UvrD-helicase domain-containing protein, partial [Paraglaciecola sp.]|uniref:UvrD-helicase domain-containing protein n=1 Tax=Paraglaciecola sp. TaxID=1920173 RepID=UPI003EF8C708